MPGLFSTKVEQSTPIPLFLAMPTTGTINYIVCQEPGRFMLKQKKAPQRKSAEALLKIEKIGICGTDLHAYSGHQPYFTYPRILGHELAAKILEIDPHPTLSAGDPVVVMPYLSCGSCIACRQGKSNCCTELKVLGVHTDGGMQEVISLPVELLIPAPGLSFKEMAIVEPLAIGAHAVRRAQITLGEFVAVIGCGPIGLGILKLAQIAGARVIALDLNEQRLQFARSQLGVDHALKVDQDALDSLKQITGNDLATAVFDATGNRQALESGHRYMSHGGRYLLVGLSSDTLGFSHPEIHAKETTLMCSRNATREDFYQVISALEKQLFPVESFVTHMVPFHRMIDHFKEWLDPGSGVIKPMIDFN